MYILRYLRRLEIHKKSSRYFIYALGEIILIVVGIMIALQINNSSQHRINLKLEKNFLQRFYTDLEDDLVYFQGELETAENGIEAVKKAVALMYGDNVEDDFYELNTLYDLAYLDGFNPQYSTYEELESTGQLNLIRDDTLRLAIQKHYANYERMFVHFDHLFVWRKNVTHAYDSETSNLKYVTWNRDIFPPETRSERDWAFLNDPEHPDFKKTETALASTSFWLTWHLGDYAEIISETRLLQQQISDALAEL